MEKQMDEVISGFFDKFPTDKPDAYKTETVYEKLYPPAEYDILEYLYILQADLNIVENDVWILNADEDGNISSQKCELYTPEQRQWWAKRMRVKLVIFLLDHLYRCEVAKGDNGKREETIAAKIHKAEYENFRDFKASADYDQFSQLFNGRSEDNMRTVSSLKGMLPDDYEQVYKEIKARVEDRAV